MLVLYLIMSKEILTNDMYVRAIEESDSGLWVCDVKSGVCVLSDRYYTMLGYEPNEFEGTMENLFKLLHPDDIESTNKIFNEFFQSKSSKYRNEVRIKNKSGDYTHILTQGIGERNDAGEIVTFIGWNIDITPLKEAQRLLDEEKVKSASQSRLAQLGLLAGGLTHEINNPLMVIQLRSQLLEKALKKGEKLTSEKISAYLETIQNSAKKIESIVKGLRSISDDREIDQKKTFPVNKLLDDVLQMLRAQLEQKKIAVKVSAPEEISILGNITLIGQVFLNLLNNSIDALEDSDSKEIHIHFHKNDKEAELVFEDSGPGIEKNNQEKIFLPFYTTKAPGKGTGLGLSISNSIVKDHKGSIEYSFENGRSKFTIKLPLV